MSLAIFRKELKGILRERTFISTVLMQLFLILFYSIAILGIMVIFDPHIQMKGRIDIIVEDNEHLAPEFLSYLADYDTAVGSIAGYENYDAAIEFISSEPYIARLYARENSFRTAFIVSEIKEAFLRFEEEEQAESVPIVETSGYMQISGLDQGTLTAANLIFEFKHLLLIPLLLFLPIYLSGVLFIDLFSEELARKTLPLLLVSPKGLFSIISQKMLASIVMSFAQIILWIVILEARGIHIKEKPELLLIVALVNLLVLCIAALIVIVFSRRAISQIIFSIFVIVAIVTKGFALNPLNLVTKLSVIEVPFPFVLWYSLGIVFAIAASAVLLAFAIRTNKASFL